MSPNRVQPPLLKFAVSRTRRFYASGFRAAKSVPNCTVCSDPMRNASRIRQYAV